ncbi:unnamed protein product [Colletotrichum noveboracense]|uniref:Uncharacterized protein n=1 Tax=Colletotrichum noveboracense TaxID=2664923 RepID=A0A9W4W7H7_9PEZI|nr:unnamed protein product [Colletotrichum noveboracense]
MDILQFHHNGHASSVSLFIEEILINEEVPEAHVNSLAMMIMDHLPAGDTIQQIAFFVEDWSQHELSDLKNSEWRWSNIHLPTIGIIGTEYTVSTETALVELWKAMAEVTKDDDNLTKAQEFAQDSIEDSKAMLHTTKSANETFLNSQLEKVSM